VNRFERYDCREQRQQRGCHYRTKSVFVEDAKKVKVGHAFSKDDGSQNPNRRVD
jgi:hypothetical protein